MRGLSERGIRTDKIVAEDWGYRGQVETDGLNVDVCCGHRVGDDDGFLCFTEPGTPVVRRLFRKIDYTAALSRLVDATRQILSADPEIREVEWMEPGQR